MMRERMNLFVRAISEWLYRLQHAVRLLRRRPAQVMPTVRAERIDKTEVVIRLSVPVGTRVTLRVEAPRGPEGGLGQLGMGLDYEPLKPGQRSERRDGRPTLPAAYVPLKRVASEQTEPLPAGRPEPLWPFPKSRWSFRKFRTLASALFASSAIVYLVTRLVGLEDWPIYFFTDEAVHANRAQEFLRDGFRFKGELLPTYFQNGPFWNISTSVYLQVLPVALLGKSVVFTRGLSVIVTLVGALALALMLRNGLAARYWWTAVLFLSTAPVWFLHSRTAFEVMEMASLYAVSLACYLQYLRGRRGYLYPAIVAAAAAFYAYSPGQIVLVATTLGLLLSDWRYHFQSREVAVRALLLGVLLALPLVRFQVSNPGAAAAQLHERGSFLVRPVPLQEKIERLVGQYAEAISPSYWFVPNSRDLARHLMFGHGHLWPFAAVLAGIGLLVCLRQIRSAEHRVLIVALLAAPTGAALAEIAVTRAMPVVIPAVALMVIGLERLVPSMERRLLPLGIVTSVSIFLGLAWLNVSLLRDALANGPTWHRNYGLYGMQWGGRQLLGSLVPEVLQSDPSVRLGISPSWANGTGELFNFFLTPQQRSRVVVRTVDNYLNERLAIAPGDRLVMTPEEYGRAVATPRFKTVQVERTLNYPDGRPGFYLGSIEYADDIDDQLALAREQEHQAVSSVASYRGEVLTVVHSRLGAGDARDLFDGDRFTLVRGLVANPLVLDLRFPASRAVSEIKLTTGTMGDFSVRLIGYEGDRQIARAEQRFQNQPDDPTVTVAFASGAAMVDRMVVEVLDNQRTVSAQTHVREIEF
jgi:hypothetical protein